MHPLRAALLALALLTGAASPAVAQSLPTSAYSLGLALPLSGSWVLRSDYSPGLKWAVGEQRPDYGSSLDNNRASLYADWFPFTSSGFRVVGGVSLNDTPAGLTGSYPSGAWGGSYQMRQRALMASTTYLGIGYGQHGRSKGLGFYADMGVALGGLGIEADGGVGGGPLSTLNLEGWRMQNNGLLGFRYLPSVSLGLIYRY